VDIVITYSIKDTPPKSKKARPKNWHPWVEEVQRRNQIRQLKLITANLAINAVVASDDDKDNLA
jgi:hypothetical protein